MTLLLAIDLGFLLRLMDSEQGTYFFDQDK
jgi:hypothetical protein